MDLIPIEPILAWGLPFVVIFGVTFALWWVVRKTFPDTQGGHLARQLTQLALVILANIMLVLSLPIAAETAAQLLSLFGLVITGVIALSSTTFVANLMAGIMLRTVGSFNVGDFIRVGDNFGRVTERAVLHTEIQTEDRDLITLPNLYLMNQPVKVVHASGTLISADLSLGYDEHRSRISGLLKEAAEDAELEDPFVQIIELGNYAVSYRVSGFLRDVSRLVGKRSELKAKAMDRLHEAGIEIVSPTFMNQRQITTRIIPRRVATETAEADAPEALMFEKAELATRLERLKQQREKLADELKELEKNTEMDESRLRLEVAWRERQIGLLDDALAEGKE